MINSLNRTLRMSVKPNLKKGLVFLLTLIYHLTIYNNHVKKEEKKKKRIVNKITAIAIIIIIITTINF